MNDRRYDFEHITGYEEYREKVPVITYQDIAGDIGCVVDGEKNILPVDAGDDFTKCVSIDKLEAGKVYELIMHPGSFHALCRRFLAVSGDDLPVA